MKYVFDTCALEVGTRRLTRDGEERHVEPQVFDLILHLVESRGRIVPKDELVARVWKGRAVSDATIASRLNAARRVLGDDGRAQRIIATVSRQGVRFVADVTAVGEGRGQPSVAVMPFRLQPPREAYDYLAQGLAEELATTMGRAGWFEVRDISAGFSRDRDGLRPGASAADYAISGVLQLEGEHLRLSLRLIETAAERQIWARTFESKRADLFALQDRLAAEVIGEIEPLMRQTELARSVARHGNLTAFDHYLRALSAVRGMDLPSLAAARTELEQAVAEHPAYGAAHGMLAWIATLMIPQGRRADTQKALKHARTAIREGAFDCDALAMGGYALGFFERDPAAGLGFVRRGLALNPSSARGHDHAGWLLLYDGMGGEAETHFDRALRLCPVDEFAFRILTGRAFARLFQRDFDGAVVDARRAHAVAPTYTICHRVLAAALAHAGQARAAASVIRDLTRLNPGLRLKRYEAETRFAEPASRALLMSGLRQAGMPA